MCTDEDIRKRLLDQDKKNTEWYGENKDFKPLVFLFCGGRYWDWAYSGDFELFTSPPKLSVIK